VAAHGPHLDCGIVSAPDRSAAGEARRPGRPRGSVASTTEATREGIVEVAIELFSEIGYHATSVAEIGARTDLQPGALYYHIKSKEDLLWEILRRYTEEALAGARRVIGSDDGPVTKLEQLIDVHVAIIVEHRREVLIQMRDADALNEQHARQLLALRQEVQDCWEQVLVAGHRSGEFVRANRIVANGLLGMMNSISQWYKPQHGYAVDDIAAQFKGMVLQGLVGRSAAD
jgi:TetR/AcrR family transcriptional regulator, cholesterol catabolism regulator